MLLGLSLFNLAAAFGKTKGEELPKRARQIRKREKEEVKPEVHMVADIAEQEAKAVIAQQETQTQAQAQTQQLSTMQQTVRAVAIVVWSVSAVVFFGSMVFNYPFGLGKAALSLLPGIPHVATLSLDASDQPLQPGGPVPLTVLLDSNGEVVTSVKATIQFDPNVAGYESYVLADPTHGSVKVSNPQPSLVELVFSLEQPHAFKKEALATITFVSKQAGDTTFGIDFDRSAVLKRNQEQHQNILGKVTDAEVRLPEPQSTTVRCAGLGFAGAELQQVDRWKDFSQGTILPGEQSNWVSLTNDVGVLCGHEGSQGYVIIAAPQGMVSRLTLRQKNQVRPLDVATALIRWTIEGQSFSAIPLPNADQPEPFSLTVLFGSGEEIRWPEAGSAQFVFE